MSSPALVGSEFSSIVDVLLVSLHHVGWIDPDDQDELVMESRSADHTGSSGATASGR